jgi:hypothetical protein
MATKSTSTAKEVVETKSYQVQLNEIDNEIAKLTEQKKVLAKLALEEAKAIVEMPLHQLNAIGQLGYEKAKETYGEKWVE